MRYFMFCLRFLLLLPLLSIYNIQLPLSLPLSNSSIHLCHHEDATALLQFIQDFVIDSSASKYCAHHRQTVYPKIKSWNHNNDCCSWDGVLCDSLSGHVIELDLSCSLIRGTINSNSTLFQLQRLQGLNLAFNHFYNSNISPKFGQFSHLKYLNLSTTYFTGKVPVEIARLSRLISLHISSYNTLEMSDLGLITKNMTDLKELVLEGVFVNSLMPQSLVNLSSLTSLKFLGTGMRGNFPTDILHLPHLRNLHIEDHNLHANFSGFSWTSPLEKLILSSPHFTGKLPKPAGPTHFLRILSLICSNFYGVIPSWVWRVTEEIDLSSNKLSGQLVIKYVNISRSLWSLDLSSNNIHGLIPISIFELKSLSALYLQSHKLNGTVDFNMFHKLKSLSFLWLSNNNLSLSFKNIGTTTVSHQFIQLGLSSCNLGKFPDFLIYQESLDVLELSNNIIHGQVPHWLLVKNTLTFLDISNNYLIGGLEHIPWSNLTFINLSSNMFRGPLPQLPPFIQAYLVSNNKFTGEIPSTICNSKTLLNLDFSNNSLTGSIPRCLGNLSGHLRVLNLKLNKFNGTLPQDFARCGYLENFNVNGNLLEGPIPTSLSNCLSLKILDLGNNKIDGKFPYWLGTLQGLEVLVLHSNKFWGPLTELDNGQNSFPKLRILDIANNRFSGNFPPKLINSLKAMMNMKEKGKYYYMNQKLVLGSYMTYYYMFSTTLTFKGTNRELERVMPVETAIDVSRNSFKGNIPNEIMDLVSLRWLNLSHNNFSGIIPPSLGNLSMLESLDISSNELVGHIPKELVSLTSLEFFNASRNQLVGPIPVGKQFDTFQNESYLGNTLLCGPPLSNKCGDNDEDDDDAVETPSMDHYDSQDINVWEIILIGYGSGIVIGLSIGYLVFCVKNLFGYQD